MRPRAVRRPHRARQPVRRVVAEEHRLVLARRTAPRSRSARTSPPARSACRGGSRRRPWAGRSSRPASSGSSGGPPPHTSRAPSATPSATYAATFSRCAADTSGPLSVAGSSPLPSRTRSARRASSATNSSCTGASSSSRVPAEHTCPACRNAPLSAPSSAASRSASANTMFGFLPPSSSATFLTSSAAARMIARPVASPPVNDTRSTSGADTSAAPTLAPAPSTRLTTPAGVPAFSSSLDERDRRQRRHLARLQDDGVAGGQRRRDLPRHLQQRVVPRRDQRAHARPARRRRG